MKTAHIIWLSATLLAFAPAGASAAPGDPDSFSPNFGEYLTDITLQPDGGVLVAGPFSSIGTASRVGFARFSSTGVLDDFAPNGATANCMGVQEDGKIVVGGIFTTLNGQAVSRFGRLNPDGTLDSAFNPSPNGAIYSVALQADGGIFVGGSFTNIAGTARTGLARLNSAGSIDAGFNQTPNGIVYCVAPQADGKILCGGFFGLVGGVPRNYIARLNADGTLDTNFNPNATGSVNCLGVQADGKIVVGGDFTSITGVPRNRLARLNSDGTLDTNFNASASSTVQTLALQVDGKIIAGGTFTNINGTTKVFVARLNTNGTLDTNFSAIVTNATAPSDEVNCLALQADGRVLVGGLFHTVNGGRYFARLANDPAPQSLTVPATNRIQWLRGGSAPEVQYVRFELSTNGGATYTSLGYGTRISGGWQLTGLSLPALGKIRARARAADGLNNGSSALFETVAVFGSQPDVALSGNGFEIYDGDSAPRLGAGTDFGLAGTTNGVSVSTFNITNNGNSSLALGSITIGGTNLSDFTVTAQPAPTLAPGGSTSFQITFTPAAIGLRSGTVSFTNNAIGKNPFDFSIQGTGLNTLDSGFVPYADNIVYGLAVQPDGKILLAGDFTSLNGGINYHIARLNADGTSDLGFDPSVVNASVHCLAVQSDGKILAGGMFSTIAGGSRKSLARLNSNGTLDPSFNANLDYVVYCMAVQADGRILIGGVWTTMGGTNSYLARLNVDGSFDSSFTATTDQQVYSIAVQSDGRIILGGGFSKVNGVSHFGFARLSPDGTLDTSYTNCYPNCSISAVAVQPDGKVLIGGCFNTLLTSPITGVTRHYIARLNTDSTPDLTFDPSASDQVNSIALQANGKILLGGWFTMMGGAGSHYIARVNADGTRDPGFNPDPNNHVQAIALQADGRVVFGGDFLFVGNLTHSRIARTMNEPATQSLTAPTASRIQWLRGGSSPESQLVTFEAQTNGATSYTLLGSAARISGGWELTGLSLPPVGHIRARARTMSGYQNGSLGYAEAFALLGNFPEASVAGKGLVVTNGDITPNVADGTDFGIVAITGVAVTNTFAITNIGNLNLTLGSISVGGPNAADFTVIAQPGGSLTAGASTAFQVRFDPSATGLRSATLSFTNNNTARNPFTFSIQGTGLNTAPAISHTTNQVVAEDVSTGALPVTIGDTESAAGTLTLSGSSTNQTLVPNANIVFGGSGSNRTVTITPAANQSGTTSIALAVSDGSLSSTDRFLVTVTAVNDPPTIDAISNPAAISEDAGLQTVNLTGISAGGGETQTLVVTASSGNTNLIPNPTVTYTSPNATGSLSYTPVANASGAALITVTVNDSGTSNNITTRTFTVTVTPVNDPPTIDAISNPAAVNEDAGLQTVNLTGLSAGGGETQTLTVSASSGNTNLIPNPTVTYTSPGATGSLSYTPVANASGSALITVTVNDGGTSNNITTRTFTVTVNAVNDPPTIDAISNPAAIDEDAGLQTVNLTGITAGDGETQALIITATSGNTNLIPNPTVTYTSPNATGSLSYTPVTNANGIAIITVTINDGGTSNNLTARTFTVAVNAVNDAPMFTKGPDDTQPYGTTNAQIFANWATGIDDGDAEVTQALTFNVTNSNPGLFTTAPSVALDGTLSYTPNGASGTATIGVSLTDDATAGGPALTSPVQTFTITVTEAVMPLPPTIDSISVLGNGAFQLSFTNTNNTTFSVLAAVDLGQPASNWSLLGLSTNIGGGLHQFTDPQATNFPSRFYRLRFP